MSASGSSPALNLDDCPPVMRVDEAARVALVDAKTIRRAIHAGELRALVSGRVIRVHRGQLEAWLRGETAEAVPRLRVAGRG